VDDEAAKRREGSCRARRVRPLHGRTALFIYYRQTIHASDITTLLIVSFLLGMFIGFCWYYSCYMDSIIAYGQKALGW
jgi:hypothetical protein